jgi:hypothetical protein
MEQSLAELAIDAFSQALVETDRYERALLLERAVHLHRQAVDSADSLAPWPNPVAGRNRKVKVDP